MTLAAKKPKRSSKYSGDEKSKREMQIIVEDRDVEIKTLWSLKQNCSRLLIVLGGFNIFILRQYRTEIDPYTYLAVPVR